MQTMFKVQRYNPEAQDIPSYYQEYVTEVDESDTVLDALIQIRETQDESLALRCSCRGAICGSCGMRINGHAALACKTKIITMASPGGTISVEPMRNMPVIKDLITDMASFWSKIRQVTPWLQPTKPAPQTEYVASPASMTHLSGVMGCIMCGVCVSDCTVLEVDSTFLGPAALAKAYRFTADPRDTTTSARLTSLNEPGGMWDCTRCMECIQVCPKGVAPMDRIMSLRAQAMKANLSSTTGARHAEEFINIIRDKGTLDEPMLALKTHGMFNIGKILSLIPIGLRALFHNKMPRSGPLHHAIPGIAHIQRMIDKLKATP